MQGKSYQRNSRREFPRAGGYDFSTERAHQAPSKKNKKRKKEIHV